MWKLWAVLVIGGLGAVYNGVTGKTCTYIAGKLHSCDSSTSMIVGGILLLGLGAWRLWAWWRREAQVRD